MSAGFVDFAVDTLIWTGALIGLVLVLRRPVARLFGPQIAYALWLLPAMRLVLPPLVVPLCLVPEGFAPVASDPVPAAAGADTVVTTVTVSGEAQFALPWALLLTAAWLSGAALFLLVRFRDYHAMRRRLLAGSVEVDVREGVRLVETPAVDAPVAFGLRDKVVALPPRFMISGSLAERALAIEHELAHHRGRDLLANWLAQPLLALHWFNPLAWAAWDAMRRDQEAACDARVLGDRDPATRAAYARVIASFAVPARLGPRAALAAPMACPVLGDKSIVHRLRSLTMTEISPNRRRAGRWALALSGALTLPLSATVVYADQDRDRTRDAPVAPAAPEAPPAKEAPKVAKRVMIATEHADRADGKDRPEAKHEKRLERDGKTIVIHSDTPIDEAELEAKLAKLPEIIDLEGPSAPGAKGERREFRKIITQDGHEKGLRRFAMVTGKCDNGRTLADVDSRAEEAAGDGRRVHRTHILLCGKPGESRTQALTHVRKARERMAEQGDMPEGVRSDVLRKLDEAIARLEAEAR